MVMQDTNIRGCWVIGYMGTFSRVDSFSLSLKLFEKKKEKKDMRIEYEMTDYHISDE